MFDPSRVTRLLTLALATCAVTWVLAGGALAQPNVLAAPGQPTPSAEPAFNPGSGDHSVPNAAQVQRVLADLDRAKSQQVTVSAGHDDTTTIALILSIAAIVTAVGAVTLTVMRTHQSAVRA